MIQALQKAFAGGTPVELSEAGPVERPDVLERFPRAAVVVRTSGSTGQPKQTVLSAAALEASAAATAQYLGFTGSWLLCLPVNYVAGLSVLTRSLFAGSTVTTLEGNFTAEKFAAAGPHTLTSLVPTQLQRILENPAATKVAAAYRGILVGGAATNPSLYRKAVEAGLPIHRTYGMAETCGGCVYDGKVLPGVEIRVHDGRIAVAGPMLAEGYLHPNDRFITLNGKRFYLTDDVGTYDDGALTVQGRADDVINTGGIKVSAAHIQNVLAQATTAEVFVTGVPDPVWGTRVCAAVEDSAASVEQLSSSLTGAAAPKSWWLTDALPRLSTGKVDRGAVQEYFQQEGR